MSIKSDLLGKRVEVLDQGWVELQDMMGDDLAIVNAARVSFLGESKGGEADKKLLFYLLRHRHTSPFEMVEFKFRVRAPVITWWQWARHRTWNFNAQCLAGDTQVIFDKPEMREKGGFRVGSKITLRELYRRWPTWERERLRAMQLRTMDEESMLLSTARIGDVVYAGVKPGFRVTVCNGHQITCSADHRFLFEDGWKTLAEGTGLELVNNRATWRQLPQVYVNGQPLTTSDLYTDPDWLRYQYHTRHLKIAEMAELAKCSTHTIRKYLTRYQLTSPERQAAHQFKQGDKPWNNGRSYSLNETLEQNLARRERAARSVPRGLASNFWKGGVSSDRANIARWTNDVAAYVFARDKYQCLYCERGANNDDPFHTHHLIPVWADESVAYEVDNLVTLHRSCHYHLHGHNLELEFAQRLHAGVTFDMALKDAYVEEAIKPHGHATPRLTEIINIEYVGEIEMYDLVVDGPFPNFIANWFVVHNSGRYTPFQENDFYVPQIWRKQAKDNKQASEGEVDPETGAELTRELLAHYEKGFALYERALAAGVAREQARLFLPGFSLYYTWVTKVDAHNLLHFLSLRMAPDAQEEIRVYAQAIYEHFLKPALPWTAEAFETYVLKHNVK